MTEKTTFTSSASVLAILGLCLGVFGISFWFIQQKQRPAQTPLPQSSSPRPQPSPAHLADINMWYLQHKTASDDEEILTIPEEEANMVFQWRDYLFIADFKQVYMYNFKTGTKQLILDQRLQQFKIVNNTMYFETVTKPMIGIIYSLALPPTGLPQRLSNPPKIFQKVTSSPKLFLEQVQELELPPGYELILI